MAALAVVPFTVAASSVMTARSDKFLRVPQYYVPFFKLSSYGAPIDKRVIFYRMSQINRMQVKIYDAG